MLPLNFTTKRVLLKAFIFKSDAQVSDKKEKAIERRGGFFYKCLLGTFERL